MINFYFYQIMDKCVKEILIINKIWQNFFSLVEKKCTKSIAFELCSKSFASGLPKDLRLPVTSSIDRE